jgi:hypothetical protein
MASEPTLFSAAVAATLAIGALAVIAPALLAFAIGATALFTLAVVAAAAPAGRGIGAARHRGEAQRAGCGEGRQRAQKRLA